MKVFEKTIILDDKTKPLILIPFGDIHIGASGVNKGYFNKTIKFIKETPNCYAIGMGDFVDAINIKDKRFDIKSIDRCFFDDLDNLPIAQMDYFINSIRPIKNRILCMIPGNHEEKFRINNSIDLMHEIYRELKIPIGDYMSFLKLKFDRKQFKGKPSPMTIWLQHGWFAGRKMGGKVNQLMDVANTYDADMYFSGHSHDLFMTTLEKMTLSPRGLDVIKTKKVFVNTGTFLETVTKRGTSYGEMKAYPVAKIGSARIKIYPRKPPLQNDIHVSI